MSIIDIKFTKFDARPWGFRLVGGSDFPQPLTVIKVNEGSLSECMGLKVGDIVVRLNDNTVSSLTHGQAHEALMLAGNNFTMGVYRKKEEEVDGTLVKEGIEPYQIPLEELEPIEVTPLDDPSEIIRCDSENKLSVEEYYEEMNVSGGEKNNDSEDVENVEDKPVDANSEIVPNKNLTDDEIAQLILEEEELLLAKGDQAVLGVNFKKLRPRAPLLKESKVLEELQTIALEDPPKVKELKHQSTFLQKPSRPIPQSKKSQEESLTPTEGYKVIIKKQPKKSVTERLLESGLLTTETLSKSPEPAYPDDSKVETRTKTPEQALKDPEPSNQTSNEEHNSTKSDDENETENNEIATNNEECVEEKNSNNEMTNENSDNVEKNSTPSNEETHTCEQPTLNEIFDKSKFQKLVSTEINLEKQLESVQNQLLALKRLPSEIENHLKIVSEQLYKIMELSGVKSNSGGSSRRDSSDQTVQTETERFEEKDEEENKDSEKDNQDNQDTQDSDKDEVSSIMSNRAPELVIDEAFEETEPPETKELEVTLRSDDSRVKTYIASYETKVFKSRTPSPATSYESYEPDANLSPQDQVIQELKHRGAKKRQQDLWPQAKQLELTYGRRWRCPNDFFNDEMIAEVLSGQAEVIRGRALGVNFKKYEKAWLPNYDHLMNSSVYKMLHKMEKEPKSGIPARPPKIPAAEDIIERVNTPA